MVLPVLAYGHPTLRRISEDIEKDYPGLDELIDNMFDTMYATAGVGLAAPQINKNIRLFIVDASPFGEEVPEAKGFKKVFINAQIIEEKGDEWSFNEGCLSLPEIREDVIRQPDIRIQYYDENFEYHDDKFSKVMARIIQHEYDHLEGILFVDRIPNIRKILLKRKLSDISKGNIDVDYKMIFPKKKKGRRR
jgi:peptide deformylase